MPKYHTDNWGNARQMSIDNPDTFYYDPLWKDLEVQEGDLIKIANGSERFWTRVVKTRRNQIIASLDNCLLGDYPYKLGSKLVYTRDNIYDFYRTPDAVKELYKEIGKEQLENIKVFVKSQLPQSDNTRLVCDSCNSCNSGSARAII